MSVFDRSQYRADRIGPDTLQPLPRRRLGDDSPSCPEQRFKTLREIATTASVLLVIMIGTLALRALLTVTHGITH